MKLLIVSDSHGNIRKLQSIVENEIPFDYLIHCGDGCNDVNEITLPENVSILTVVGNIDRAHGIKGPTTQTVRIKNFTIFITHGDIFGAHHDITGVWSEAKRLNCDIACFGHTHRPMNEGTQPYMFNPGATQSGMYGILLLDDKIKGELKKI